MHRTDLSAALDAVVDFFQTLTPATLGRLRELYDGAAEFKDPFNEIRGLAAIERVFAHMFATLESPRFVVTGRFIADGDAAEAMLLWEFRFSSRVFGRGGQCIRGSTHLRFAADGKVLLHRDYWDAAEELYARLPGLGLLMRALRRRLAAG